MLLFAHVATDASCQIALHNMEHPVEVPAHAVC